MYSFSVALEIPRSILVRTEKKRNKTGLRPVSKTAQELVIKRGLCKEGVRPPERKVRGLFTRNEPRTKEPVSPSSPVGLNRPYMAPDVEGGVWGAMHDHPNLAPVTS